MRIYIPHPFKKHDNFINMQVTPFFYLKPWYNQSLDIEIQYESGDEVYDNFAGWLWFQFHWYSEK